MPEPTDGPTCPLSDEELLGAIGRSGAGTTLGEYRALAIAAITADRARLREWFRVVYGDSSPFDRACGDVDAKAREG